MRAEVAPHLLKAMMEKASAAGPGQDGYAALIEVLRPASGN